ncbi:hypothetical protein SUDANB140_02905 [Streptomyces sp. enrichment culture]
MSSDGAAGSARVRWNRAFRGLQKMGRSLQLPIAVLPAAGILNRLGQPDVFGEDGLGWSAVSEVMMARKSDGSTVLAAVAGFLVYFRFAVTRFGLGTPGREPEDGVEDVAKGWFSRILGCVVLRRPPDDRSSGGLRCAHCA